MDDLTLMAGLGAERAAAEDHEARAAARRALEARFEMASATSTARPAHAGRTGRPSVRLRLGVFAGATALAALLAGVLVLGSGPTAEPAAAEILHRTAAVAAGDDAPQATPGPGQFLYRRFERLELQGWVPGADGLTMGSPPVGPGAAGGFTALVATTQELWDAPDGAGRVREVAGTPRFLTSEEEERWEAAGSPPPAPGGEVLDTEHPAIEGFHLPDTSTLPTDPVALRQAIEARGIRGAELGDGEILSGSAEGRRTITSLFDILAEGTSTSSRLRAATFDALAEMPGIEVDTGATDSLGRRGDAIRQVDRQTGSGTEFVFDPDTAELLAEREFIGDPEAWIPRHVPRGEVAGPTWKGLRAGLTIRETDYLESGVVDSTHESGA